MLIVRGWKYHFRWHILFALAAGLACAVITGALFVDDSVKATLRRFAQLRLGRVEYAAYAPGRFYSEKIASDIAVGDADAASVLYMRGAGGKPFSAETPVAAVDVLGVDAAFWRFGNVKMTLAETECAVSERVSRQLGIKEGDDISLSVRKPELLSRDALLSSRSGKDYVSLILTVVSVVNDEAMGRFSLKAEQIPAPNVFVNLKRLQRETGMEELANIFLSSDPDGSKLKKRLESKWEISKAGFQLRASLKEKMFLLENDAVFWDAKSASAVESFFEDQENCAASLAYLVNTISKTDPVNMKITPYSFIVAIDPSSQSELSSIPPKMGDSDIIINSWLADQISAGVGDNINIKYFQLTGSGDLQETSRTFNVWSVISMDEALKERELVPKFPGLSDVDNCRDWSIGMTLDETLLADKPNEAYWNSYRETPKAFVTLTAGREMWANRFGDTTAFRLFRADLLEDDLAQKLAQILTPDIAGLVFEPVRFRAGQAVAESMDFGTLFLAMSFFLIVSSFIMLALLLSLSLRRRFSEAGLLSAIGYSKLKLFALWTAESVPVILVGIIAGAFGGVIYTKLLIAGLGKYWSDAVAGARIFFSASYTSFSNGVLLAVAVSLIVVCIETVRAARKSPTELLSSHKQAGEIARRKIWTLTFSPLFGVILTVLAVIAVVHSITDSADRFISFFLSGVFMLIAGAFFGWWLLGKNAGISTGGLSLMRVGIMNVGRRRGRSLAVGILVAGGCFMVISVACMKEDPTATALRRSSGTGGFRVYAESALPLKIDDFTERDGAKIFKGFDFDGSVVPMKLRDGDDSSCLNLNRAQVPRIIGVEPFVMQNIGAFIDKVDAWQHLLDYRDEDTIPVLAGDGDTKMWGLGIDPGKGDVLLQADGGTRQKPLRVVGSLPMRLSVFQGALLMSMDNFNRLYPEEEGYRVFLLDTRNHNGDKLAATLMSRFRHYGMDAMDAGKRLTVFLGVQNSYMAMYFIIGGLGLLLGAFGVGLVAALSVIERRMELATLRALGFIPQELNALVFWEFAILLVPAALWGTLTAVLSGWPYVKASSVNISIPYMVLLVLGIILAGFFSVGLAIRATIRRPLLDSLRDE